MPSKTAFSVFILTNSSFMWIQTDEMTPMVYLFTVLVQLHAGNMEKVVKYGEKTLNSVDRLKHKR